MKTCVTQRYLVPLPAVAVTHETLNSIHHLLYTARLTSDLVATSAQCQLEHTGVFAAHSGAVSACFCSVSELPATDVVCDEEGTIIVPTLSA